MSRDVGVMGESRLEAWAAETGITANKSTRDKSGWDYIIEFPIEGQASNTSQIPLDQRELPPQCLIQVKSTDSKGGHRSVSLKTWERLAKHSLPAFFLYLEYDGQSDPQRAKLIHVNEKYIGRVLKRLRELSAHHLELNNQTMTFDYDEQDAIKPLNGMGFKQAIQQRIGNNLFSCMEEKRRVKDNIGYEGPIRQISFRFCINNSEFNPQESLVRLDLGMLPSDQCNVVDYSVRDIRFGILAPEPIFSAEILDQFPLERHPNGIAVMEWRTPNGLDEITITTEYYSQTNLSLHVNEEFHQIRLTAPCMDFILYTSRFELTPIMRFPRGPNQISRLRDIANFILFIDRACSSSTIETEINCRIVINSDTIIDSSMFIQPYTLSSKIIHTARLIQNTYEICKYFEILDDAEVDILQLLYQDGSLGILAGVLRPSPRIFRFASQEVQFNPNVTYGVPLLTHIFLENHRIDALLIALVNGNIEFPTNQDNIVSNMNIHLVKSFVDLDENQIRNLSPQRLISMVDDYIRSRKVSCELTRFAGLSPRYYSDNNLI